jgi:formylglycine-generating enzyme required for sulfatase activity
LFCLAISGLGLAQEPGMKLIPEGEFHRGRTHPWTDQELAWYPNPLKDDLPVRTIGLEAFWMDEAEVTGARYAAFVAATGHRAPFHWKHGKLPESEANQPVVNVSQPEAAAFCAWDGKRLPTEAEWERACRGPQDDRTYPWGDEKPTAELAHFGSQEGGPTEVCSKQRNDFGLCDMIGNAWEWTADWYGRDYYAEAPDSNPPGPESGKYKVLRGGSWSDTPASQFMTCSYRSWARAAERSPNLGFRCVKPAKP